MRTTCLVSHYNYGEFIGEAVASALAQTHSLDEIIVIDDGSSEDHLAQARKAATQSDCVQLIEKSNGGQLSCLQVGFDASLGELVFFLDADDRWKPGYVARVLELLSKRPEVDFVATNKCEFYSNGEEKVVKRASRDRGYSIALCLEKGGVWFGAPTSCLAIKRQILEKVFPVPNPTAWSICADEALVYGASLVGAHQYFLGDPLVEYRVHDNNSFFGKKDSPAHAFHRRLNARMLIAHLRARHAIPPSLMQIVHYEFATIEQPTVKELMRYMRATTASGLAIGTKFGSWLKLLKVFFRSRWGPRPVGR